METPSAESQRVFAPGILEGQVAIVTGGGTGIGLATAKEMIRLGARVAICGRTPAKLEAARVELEATATGIEQAGALVHTCDIREPVQVEAFVKTVLVDWLHVSEVWVGANFLFGRDRAGTFSLLRTLGGRYGFNAEKIDPVRYKDFVVSSTRIRRLISEARVDEAGALLGHQYFIDNIVVRGDQRGRTIGFPTANLATDNELLPANGVYATTASVNGVVYPSVTNIGVRPTVDNSGRVSIETHIFGFDRDLYGRSIRVGFVQRLRDERKFESLDALRAQIEDDCSRARVLFERLSL